MANSITKPEYLAIGVMSGTSLDGLDIALCKFIVNDNKWSFEILKSHTFIYDSSWKNILATSDRLEAAELLKLHHQFGEYIGLKVKEFLADTKSAPDLIASHGHTVFHRPDEGITLQIGYGEDIYKETNIPVVTDFRTKDVIYGGQGAPLVPIGDELLFNQYDYCLNLGGFSNVSFMHDKNRIAFDICPCNMALNEIASKLGFTMDRNGELARQGKMNNSLFEQLNSIDYYSKPIPKSLGKEWFVREFASVISNASISEYDILRTVTEHIAYQVSITLKGGKTIVTGGGARNRFLLELLQEKSESEIILPSVELIDYKEAIIFALLGVLRIRNEINIYSSVTGASKDLCSGIIFNS